MARYLVAFFACIALAIPSLGQSSVSGTVLFEPFAGRFFSSPIENADVFGGRATWRRSYSRTYYASFFYGGDSRREQFSDSFSERREYAEWSHALGVIGIGSTLVDRDATGSAGLHLLLGIGYVSSSSYEEWESRDSEGSVFRTEFDRKRTGPLIDFGLTGELELFTPRLLLRGHGNVYVGINADREEYEGLLWLPGVSLTAGIAAAF